MVLGHLGGELARRPATSREEASAAAYINGRLRDAGFGVGTDSFAAAGNGGFAMPLLLVLALAAAALIPLAALLSAALALIVALLWLVDSLRAPLPTLARRRTTQNIVATMAVQGSGGLAPKVPRRRVVLLAPLDTAPGRQGLGRLIGYGRAAIVLRVLACTAITGCALLVVFGPDLRWAWLAIVPSCYLLLLLLLTLAPTHHTGSGGAGALAALIQIARRLQPMRNVEVWAVALGATSTDASAIAELLRLYPFDRNTTLFIALTTLDAGQLVYTTREGALRTRECDTELIALLTQVGSQELRTENREPRTENRELRTENRELRTENREPRTENREPRSQRAESRERRAQSAERRAQSPEHVPLAVELFSDRSLIAPLLRDGYRAASLLSVSTPDGVATPALVEQCAELIRTVIVQLDGDEAR
jgi:hypothetical protein